MKPHPTARGVGRRRRSFVGAALAALALAAVTAIPAADADASGTARWTRSLQFRLSPEELGVPASASARRLARAAVRRSAVRLGLPRSLAGLRLERHERVPAGPSGGLASHSLRFQQTSGGRRVVWSQLEVLVADGNVRSIDATIVPVGPGRPATHPRIGRRRALAIAHGAVPGRESGATPELVTYAGDPGHGRAPRLAWLVETLPAGEGESEAPTGLCVVLDARSGRLLTTWRGSAAHAPARRRARSTAARAARVTRERIILLRDALVPSVDPPTVPELEIGSPYSSWAATGNSFVLANWDPSPFKFTLAGPVQPGLEATVRNTKDVLVHLCFTRGFCSRDGLSDGTWSQTQVTGNSTIRTGGKYVSAFERVYLDPRAGYQNDVIAHELGHEITIVRGGDSLARDAEQREVAEGFADMFAYDFDREDATLGEDGPAGKGTSVPLRSWNAALHGEPLRMADYRCNADPHVNSEILSHAYFSFVQQIGSPAAGFVLYKVPPKMGPGARFVGAANAFVSAAAAAYPAEPRVAAAARQAFLVDAGLATGPPPCSAVAPPAPTPTPTPTPMPVADVAVPDVGGDSAAGASAELTAVGLRLGTQRSVVDDTCEHIGRVLSQTPSAGTRVPPGTAVNVSIGVRPTHPCP